MKKILGILGSVIAIAILVGVIIYIWTSNKIESKYVVSDDYQTVNIVIFEHEKYEGEYTIDTSGKVKEKTVSYETEKLLNNVENLAFIYNKKGNLVKILTEPTKIDKLRDKGYYIGPETTVYSSKKKEKSIGFADIDDYRKDGWFYGEPTTLYDKDGGEIVVGENDILAYQNLGWSKEKFITLYAIDGRVESVVESEVEDFKTAGWFDTKEEAEAAKIQQEKERAEREAQQAEIRRTTICPVNGYSKIRKVKGSSQAEIYMCPAHGSHVYIFSLGCFLE